MKKTLVLPPRSDFRSNSHLIQGRAAPSPRARREASRDFFSPLVKVVSVKLCSFLLPRLTPKREARREQNIKVTSRTYARCAATLQKSKGMLKNISEAFFSTKACSLQLCAHLLSAPLKREFARRNETVFPSYFEVLRIVLANKVRTHATTHKPTRQNGRSLTTR